MQHLVIAFLTIGLLALSQPSSSIYLEKSLDGKWRLESVEEYGKPIEIGDTRPRWIIKDNSVHYAGELLAELKIDEISAPKCLDLTVGKPRRTYEGIYAIDGDTLKLCVNRDTEGAKERPQEFVTEGKANLRLLTFKRDTEASNDPLQGVAGFVGIMIGLSEEKKVVVVGTIAESPAEKAGLTKDDIVISVDGTSISDLQTLVSLIRKYKPSQEIAFKINRAGIEKELRLKVGKMPFIYLD